MDDGVMGAHMGIMRVHEVVVDENLMGFHAGNEVLNHGNVGIGDFALSVRVIGIEWHPQVVNVLFRNSQLATCHQSLAEHNRSLEEAHIAVSIDIGCFIIGLCHHRIDEIVTHIGLEVFQQAIGKDDTAHEVFIVHRYVSVGLEGDSHVMALLDEPPHGAAHRDHHIVGVGAKDEHPFGVGHSALGAVGVVGIRLAARPTSDGVLQIVEYLDVDIIG